MRSTKRISLAFERAQRGKFNFIPANRCGLRPLEISVLRQPGTRWTNRILQISGKYKIVF